VHNSVISQLKALRFYAIVGLISALGFLAVYCVLGLLQWLVESGPIWWITVALCVAFVGLQFSDNDEPRSPGLSLVGILPYNDYHEWDGAQFLLRGSHWRHIRKPRRGRSWIKVVVGVLALVSVVLGLNGKLPEAYSILFSGIALVWVKLVAIL
jgi:hypothetical protein